MARHIGQWKPGQSGNPNGRPLKNRALTELLEKAGSKSVELSDGKKSAGKRLLASMIWELVTTGQCTFPDGKQLDLSPQDWFGLVKFIYQHVDGPPKAEVDITSNGEQIFAGSEAILDKVYGDDDEDEFES